MRKNKFQNCQEGRPEAKVKDAFQVSSRSKWDDSQWKIDSRDSQSFYIVNWEIPFGDGTTSLDQKHAVLLESFRAVFWGLMNRTGIYGKLLSPASTNPVGTGIRELFRWMVFRGYHSLANLDAKCEQRYLHDLPLILTERAKFYRQSIDRAHVDEKEEIERFFASLYEDSDADYGEITPTHDDEDIVARIDGFTYSQVDIRLRTIYHVFSQQNLLTERSLPCLRIAPFKGKKSADITKALVADTRRRIPPLPDEVALPLLRECLTYLQGKGTDILRLQGIALHEMSLYTTEESYSDKARRNINEAINSFSFSAEENKTGPWRANVTAGVIRSARFGLIKVSESHVVRLLINDAKSAAVFILQYFVGMRIGEIGSIKGGWNELEQRPACITSRFSKSGLVELFYVTAMLTKGVSTPREEKWLLGCRPLGSKELPEPYKALVLLELLFRP